MLVVSLNKESYEYDVHSLVKAFYPEEQVSVLLPESSEKKQSELQGQIRIRIEIQEESARVSVDGQEITLAGITLQVISTPGHTVGGCCYYVKEAGILISGDTLFAESVGRTDFPTGSMGTLVRSIKDKLFVLPDETRVYPGHGDSTTIGHEKEYNPFLG